MGDPDLDTDTVAEVRSLQPDLVLGRLPDARWEVDQLAKIYGNRSTVRTGAAAEESC